MLEAEATWLHSLTSAYFF